MKITINSSEAKAEALAVISTIDLTARPIQSVSITAFKKDRSSPQNRYYWKIVLGTFSDATGSTDYELHEFCKLKFLPTKIITVGLVGKEVSTSTTLLSTIEFEAYIENIKRFVAVDRGVYIPDVNQTRY